MTPNFLDFQQKEVVSLRKDTSPLDFYAVCAILKLHLDSLWDLARSGRDENPDLVVDRLSLVASFAQHASEMLGCVPAVEYLTKDEELIKMEQEKAELKRLLVKMLSVSLKQVVIESQAQRNRDVNWQGVLGEEDYLKVFKLTQLDK